MCKQSLDLQGWKLLQWTFRHSEIHQQIQVTALTSEQFLNESRLVIEDSGVFSSAENFLSNPESLNRKVS